MVEELPLTRQNYDESTVKDPHAEAVWLTEERFERDL